ncbi:uncharacterized protein LOC123263915 [Cotesia glomerata]|uniref:Uncharacterized protein n=1 Tax=Cotesia glomerata TaxID=32391 RepID=A0AAV7IQV0_COTGL|nr:uncharacterized protein LOC123263915 [Cotesia glomerata]KAH0555035.1 hypothetical protein KQX54_014830 [Cotesia glomerata]
MDKILFFCVLCVTIFEQINSTQSFVLNLQNSNQEIQFFADEALKKYLPTLKEYLVFLKPEDIDNRSIEDPVVHVVNRKRYYNFKIKWNVKKELRDQFSIKRGFPKLECDISVKTMDDETIDLNCQDIYPKELMKDLKSLHNGLEVFGTIYESLKKIFLSSKIQH